MARILVVAAHETLAERSLATSLTRRLRSDGHDAVMWQDAEEGPARSVREADAIISLLDRLPTAGAAAVALADAADKPVLGLCSSPVAPLFAQIAQVVDGQREEDWWAHLPAFYERIRPFAGRVVRDRIPELVKDAGHDVQFRQLGAQEKPRFLKQKVANEAKELLAADLAQEKEEVADVLEALEAFITARGFDREDLRRIKDHKRKQRGGFERCYVVEATAGPADSTRPGTRAQPEEAARPDGGPPPRNGHGVTTGKAVDFSYDGLEEPEAEPLHDAAEGRDIRPGFFEI